MKEQNLENLSIVGNPNRKRKSNIDFGLADELNKYYSNPENFKKKEETPIISPIENDIINPNLQTNKDFWTIDNVKYRNGIYKVNLLKELLDNGNSKTQDDWVKYSKKAQKNNDFYVGDMPLYNSLFTSLFKLKDNPEVEEIRNFLQKQFIEKWLMTLTRIKYKPSGKDEIVHNYKMPDEYSIEDNFVGNDEYVKNSKDKANYKSLLGTDNLNEINEVYNWITGKDSYLWRLNSKPKSLDERVARFYADSGGTGLYCYRYPSDTNASLGVFGIAQVFDPKLAGGKK